MKKGLIRIYEYFLAHRSLFYALTIGLFLLLGFLASRIKIEEDVARLMPNSQQTERINQIFTHSRIANDITIKISGKEGVKPEELIEVADSLESRLRTGYSPLIANIRSRVDDQVMLNIYKTVHNNLPVYLDEKDYRAIDTLITQQHIQTALETDYRLLTSASGLVLKKIIADDPIGISNIALKKLQSLQLDESYELYDGYIITKDHRNILMFVTPVNPSGESAKNTVLVEGLRDIVKQLTSHSQNIAIYYYGGPVATVCNATQLKKDSILTLSITITGLVLFIGFFFRRKRVPFIMLLPVIFGAVFALAVMAVVKGTIAILALAAASIVMGIAINYSLHFFSHYKHCGSIQETIADLLEPMTIGSFTTVGSFFSLMFVKSQILNDFGLFAGMSLTGATIFTLIFLPHFIPLQQHDVADVAHESWFDRIPAIPRKYAFIPFTLVILLTVYFFPKAMNVGFDSDLNSFNFLTPDIKKSEREITALQGDSSKMVFIASTGKDMQDALRNNEAMLNQLDTFRQKGWIRKYSSINYFIPSEKLQAEKIKRWNDYWTSEKKQMLLADLQKAGSKFHFTSSAFGNFNSLLNKHYGPVGEADFSTIRNALGSDFLIATDKFQSVVNTVYVDHVNRSKVYAELEKNPNSVVLDRAVIMDKFINIIYNDFNSILAYTSLIVFFTLLLTYGRLELTLITFLPMLICMIWILGLMDVLGLKFNIINVILSTFIFGCGDDFSIFITDGLTRKFAEGKETLSSHKVSIFLSASTIIIGLGGLIFARHPALRSIAFISIIGMVCVVVVGQVIQPFMYDFLVQRRKDRGLAPWTFPTLFLSGFAFTYFVVGCLILYLLGLITLYVLPYPPKKTRKLMYHFLISKFLGSLSYVMLNVRKVHINRERMDFSKPAVIISNHQSFLDILVTVMQNPRLILLTNHWVYYSPFFGKIVQMGDYYPVMEGADPATDKLEAVVKAGYSIVVFPEGTRSPDNRIRRFHKGAFFLAEKLNMDIVPLVLHGTGDTMGKGDFMLFNGRKTMKFLPRIEAGDTRFGNGFAEKTRGISRYFKAEYEVLRKEIERTKYFRQKLITNFIYKGPYLEYYTRYKIWKEKYYQQLHEILPEEGKITVLGCSYGFVNYLMYFPARDRVITGLDSDATKIDIANNCYSKKENLHFTQADIPNCSFEPCDVFVINEIGSYTQEQVNLLLKNLSAALNPGGSIIVIRQSNDAQAIEKFKQDAALQQLKFEAVPVTKETGSQLYIIKPF